MYCSIIGIRNRFKPTPYQSIGIDFSVEYAYNMFKRYKTRLSGGTPLYTGDFYEYPPIESRIKDLEKALEEISN